MAIEIFKRKEQKYLITTQQYQELVNQISPYMRPDKFGKDGKYTVTSLYFESDDNKIYFETKNKLRYRQKLRLRVYDDTDLNGTAFFEVKQKHKKVVNKRRVLLQLSEAYRYLKSEKYSLDHYETSNSQVLREINYFKELYNLEPEMVVSYDRHALHCLDDPSLRITFDLNLRCRKDDLLLENGPYGENFIDPNLIVLEVKVNDSVPIWLTRILQNLDCKQRSASKFCTSLELLKHEALPIGTVKEVVEIGGV
ncbi:polyphosphate polymerase domain-containing protein [Virgibacillus sp. NKC19-16]|uniref:polyphosphate polymerase domain-containing protein n=1 Tax=Virgibacillus salidurans TaxID=2831673 RepID=UPI001F35F1D5|nr:polyphosphate polymerase domain-containing protein [Virgibacillus sp. NKC19-16]UJL46854.1 polyphosphate polymerase domain-containing protein [Virgibacillus sp. NKC19-16]